MKKWMQFMAGTVLFAALLIAEPATVAAAEGEDPNGWREWRNAELELSGSWRQGTGEHAGQWWYERTDGTYPSSCWRWIDANDDGYAECYYFDSEGWMLSSSTTPDGYYVNRDGAWTENGERQLVRVLRSCQREAFMDAAEGILYVYEEELCRPDFRNIVLGYHMATQDGTELMQYCLDADAEKAISGAKEALVFEPLHTKGDMGYFDEQACGERFSIIFGTGTDTTKIAHSGANELIGNSAREGYRYEITGYDEDFSGSQMCLKLNYERYPASGADWDRQGTLYMQLEKSPYDLEFFIGTISNRPAVG